MYVHISQRVFADTSKIPILTNGKCSLTPESMNISRLKFVFVFLIFAFAFLFGTTVLLDQPPEALIGSESQLLWQSLISTILFPIKIILIGPLLPFIEFLHQDPDTPPPFFLIGFAFYWTILALIVHYLLSKIKHAR